MHRVTISKEFRFEASHVLPKHPGKCSRLHGHSWVLTVGVRGFINPETGFVVDYGDLKALVEEHVVSKLDHEHLGYGPASHSSSHEVELPEIAMPPFGFSFYPSSENLVVAIAMLLLPLVPELPGSQCQGVKLHYVRLNETCTSQAEWRFDDDV